MTRVSFVARHLVAAPGLNSTPERSNFQEPAANETDVIDGAVSVHVGSTRFCSREFAVGGMSKITLFLWCLQARNLSSEFVSAALFYAPKWK